MGTVTVYENALAHTVLKLLVLYINANASHNVTSRYKAKNHILP